MFTLPTLNYAYNALEPHIDAKTMEIHHSKHHQAYVDNLNKALDEAHKGKSLESLMSSISSLPMAVRNNGGGHWNHSFFWQVIAPPHGEAHISADLKTAIDVLGGMDALKEKFNQAAMTRFGSGWAWLIVQNKQLVITSTPNQDNPLMDVAEQKGTPILGVDVWEHAYYLNYQNRRADYLKAFWNVVNWSVVSRLFVQAVH